MLFTKSTMRHPFILEMAETCRNRTHPGQVNAPQTVLKTAEATRPHPFPCIFYYIIKTDKINSLFC